MDWQLRKLASQEASSQWAEKQVERLGNKLCWKKNEGENFPAVCLPHDGYTKGQMTTFFIVRGFLCSLQCVFGVILPVSETSFKCFLFVLREYLFREEKCDSEKICVRCRRDLRYWNGG